MQQQQRRIGLILGLVALGLLAGAALTAHPAQAVDALGPYYAEPAWDQKIPAATRFVVLTNWNSDAVLDTETGLVWEKSPSVTMQQTWAAARLYCTARTTGNRKGWRLPSMPELASLLHPTGFIAGDPHLQPGHPFLNIETGYWSATTNAEFPTRAWAMNTFRGTMEFDPKTFILFVWCVRGGNNADAY